MTMKSKASIVASAVLALGLAGPWEATAGNTQAVFDLGAAANYGILYNNTNNHNFQTSNSTLTANIGVSGNSKAFQGSSGTVNGDIDFSGSNNGGQFNIKGTHPISYNNSAVTSALSAISTLSSNISSNAAGATSVSLNPGTIDITSGTLVGDTYYFNVTSDVNPGGIVTIHGDGVHNVAFNISKSVQFGGNAGISLTGGLLSDSVIFNVTGTNSFHAGGAKNPLNGIFIDMSGSMQITGTTINGRVFGGGGGDMQFNSQVVLNQPAPPTPTVPEPSAIALALVGFGASLGFMVRKRAARAGKAVANE